MYNNYFIPHFDNDPKCLQLKVYFDIACYMGKHGAEELTALQKDSFEIKTNSEGRVNIQGNHQEVTR